MLRRYSKTVATATLMCFAVAGMVVAQDLQRDYDNDGNYLENIRIDRYLDAEVWTNHLDGDFHVGDNVVINYRTNRDAFVAIYSIDTRGRVNLLFPTEPGQDGFVRGGVTNYLPGPNDDYDLVVSGPEGVENIQIIASRERFPIPEWYPVSGLICDWDDRHEFLDHLNGRYFVRYGGQSFAFDRTALYVNEWEPTYYRPVYYPYYPSWTVCGNAYFDYPWGATVYINGIYWGCTPLYIPRIYVGWHTITIYDHWGYCWERDIHFSRYHTVVLNRDIIIPRPTVLSKYKEVRRVGYRDPVKHGYPKFKEKQSVMSKMPGVKSKTTVTSGAKMDYTPSVNKKYLRGNAKLVATERGYETAGAFIGKSKRGARPSTKTLGTPSKSGGAGSVKSRRSSDGNYDTGSRKSDYGRVGSGGSSGKPASGTKKIDSRPADKQSKGYYQKKSGSKTRKSSTQQPKVQRKQDSGSKGSKPAIKSRPSGKSGDSRKTGTVKPATSKPKSSSVGTKSTTTKTSSGKTKSSGGKTKSGGRRK